MERRLVYLLPAALTIPPQAIHAPLRPLLLQHDAHCVLEPDRVVRRVGREQEHVALVDVNVAELVVVNDLEQHGAFVLVEPFSGLVDVVVGALVGPADDHDGHAVIVDAIVVDGRLEHVGVFRYPRLVSNFQEPKGGLSTILEHSTAARAVALELCGKSDAVER